MGINSSLDLDNKVVESETYRVDGGAIHLSNKILNAKQIIDAVHHRANDLEAGQTAKLEGVQEANTNGDCLHLLSKFGEFLWVQARRVGIVTCPGCALVAEE